jgi:hypothetical protein
MNCYKLYRSQNPDETGELIATLNPNVTTYSDSALEGSLNYYYYRLCAVDSNLHQSPFTEALKSRPVTLNQDILVIDETLDFNGSNPFQPTDEMVDSFYYGLGKTCSIPTILIWKPIRRLSSWLIWEFSKPCSGMGMTTPILFIHTA